MTTMTSTTNTTPPNSPPHTTAASSPLVHPAFSARNVHTHLKTTLTLHDSDYRTWFHVFNVHCGSYGAQGHINGMATSLGSNNESWQYLYYLILSWIYANVSPDLLTMINPMPRLMTRGWPSKISFRTTRKYVPLLL
ncbi:hypothetical protein RND81_10G061800 [Saponaria officinalis]|uniref:Uncharacterized protein n=1 Tax=Saponaria officinalis TaxID=3572 RepID=A0AAW1HYZ3_SAPOF